MASGLLQNIRDRGFANALHEQRAARRGQRERRRARVLPAKRARRNALARALACVCVLGLLLAMALVVGDSDYHATIIGWLPFLMACTAVVLAYAYVQILARSITFSEYLDATSCQRNSDIRFNVAFHNPSLLFAFRMEAFFFISDLFGNRAFEASTTLSLSPREDYDMGFTTKFEHIGTYTAGLDRVVVQDFLGLFKKTIPNMVHRQVNVTPKLVSVGGVQFSTDALRESAKAAKAVLADSLDYSHVRDYVPGDPLKTIHWKLSARTETYETRLFEVYTDPGVCIVLDFYGPSDDATQLMGMFDAVVESGFSIDSFARAQGIESEVVYRDKEGTERCLRGVARDGMAQVIDGMPRMSNNAADAQDALSLVNNQVISRYGQNNLVVCTANLSSEMVSLVIEAKLRRRSPFMVAVVPRDVVGRERDAYCKSLSRLNDADIPYVVIGSAEELEGGTR